MRTYFFVTVGNLRGRCRRCGEAAESEPLSYSVSFFDTLTALPHLRQGRCFLFGVFPVQHPEGNAVQQNGGIVDRQGLSYHGEYMTQYSWGEETNALRAGEE